MQELENNFPKQFCTYHEPFLGGGAVMFNLLSKEPKLACNVSDFNSDLILAYVTIRDKLGKLIESLEDHSKNYHNDSTEYYYHVRKQEPKQQIEKVSRLIFLNRTCFNGLYRVNKKGQFNVPLGRYTNPNIVNKENLTAVSKTLKSEKIKNVAYVIIAATMIKKNLLSNFIFHTYIFYHCSHSEKNLSKSIS